MYMFQEALFEQILELPDAPLLIQKVSEKLDEERKLRKQFYNDIDESMKVEFINGEIIVHSPVMKRHNEASTNLMFLLGMYVRLNKLGFVGHEKIMTVFTRNDYEPDIVFFGKQKTKDFKEEQTLFPVPDFVVEVLSKGTAKNDRGIKFKDYESHGVKEYWIIDAKSRMIEQYLLKKGQYELNLKASEGNIRSEVIKGFEIPIQSIFNEDLNLKTMKTLLK